MLGKLTRIDNIRGIWPHEAHSFTPWLARSENMAQLSEAIGYGAEGLEVLKVEENVGSFYADIIAQETLGADSGLVLIENQFGPTNHDHLGKIITYAAGQKERVRTVVWIAEKLRDEHRAALDWLNLNTVDDIGFFGIEIELWRIGTSEPAPRFSVVSRPNDWLRADPVNDADLSDLRKLYVRYWEALATNIRSRKTMLKPQKGLPQQWTNFSIGRAHFALVATASEQSGAIRAGLEMTGPSGKIAFNRLLADQVAINDAYGPGLDWDEMPGRKQTRISETMPTVDISNELDWPRQHQWLADRLDRLHRVFHDRVRNLNLTLPTHPTP
jgi:hypothetical protein